MKITQPVTSLCIITFQKSFINLKRTKDITLKAYTHANVILVIFHYYMLQNKQFNRHSLYSMTSVVVLFAYSIKLNISTKKRVRKILLKKVIFLIQPTKCWTKFNFINTLKSIFWYLQNAASKPLFLQRSFKNCCTKDSIAYRQCQRIGLFQKQNHNPPTGEISAIQPGGEI